MKKLFLFVPILLLFWSSFSANLSIGPSEWTLWINCLEEFNITLDMFWNEKIIASDVILESNMEFVEFVNWDVFEYAAPAKQKWSLVKLLLFATKGNEITEWWNVWKIYFNVVSWVDNPYINFVFDGVGITTDTNLSIEWTDILQSVRWGEYTLDLNKECLHDASLNLSGENLAQFLDRFESDHKFEKFIKFIVNNKFIIMWWFVFWLWIILLLLFLRKKENKNAK